MAYLFDTFTNFLSGLGMSGRDKMTAYQYTKPIFTRQQLEYSYQSDWIARKAISIPAYDATREWRQWQAEQDQIESIEEIEKKLGIQLKLQQALTKARLYGGACMMIGVEGNQEEELDPEAIGKDGLKFVHVLAPHQVSTEVLNKDISSEWYSHPEFYIVRDDTGRKDEVKVHPSRMVRLIGNDPPDLLLNNGWGDPLLMMIHDAVQAAGTVAQSIAALIHEAKFDVVKIPGLTEIFCDTDASNRLLKRFSEANVAKSVINGIVIDAEEEWERIGTTFAGMPEILQMYLQIAAGAADIPSTRFLGRSPGGLNATGDSDLINYYDRVASDQQLRLTPALERLDKVIIVSALGKLDEEIFYEWNSLWQMDDAQKATIAKSKADAAKVDSDTGLVPFEALVKGRCNQLIEDGTYPGLEAAIQEAIANAELMAEEQAMMIEAQQLPGDDPNAPPGGAPPNGKGPPGANGKGPPGAAMPPPKPAPEMLLKKTATKGKAHKKGVSKRDSVEDEYVVTIMGHEYTKAMLVDAGITFDEAAWEEAKHPRGQPGNPGQFGSGGGGASPKATGAPAAAKAEVKAPPAKGAVPGAAPSGPSMAGGSGGVHHPSSREFVSPSVKSGMDVKGAALELDSRQQDTLRAASTDINKRLGITNSREVNIIGAWKDGAENSLMTSSDADWETIRLAAAMKGHVADQKAVLIFKQEDGGKSVLAQFEAKGKLPTISKQLLAAGLENHTLVPTETGARVYVCDIEGTNHDAIAKGAAKYGKDNPVFVQAGRAEFIGTQKEDGTDREQRDDARRVYEAAIRESSVPGAAALWQDVNDTWRAPTGEKGYALTANAILTEQKTQPKPNSILVTDTAKEINARAGVQLQKDLGVDHVDYENATPEMEDYVSDVIALELKDELKSGKSGTDWYDKKMKEAIDIADKIYPGLKNDPNKMFAYTAALAISSQGEVVDSSVRIADQAYSHFLEHGSFPEGIEAKDPNIGGNFRKMNGMIKQFGVDGARKFFNTTMTKAELAEQTDYDVGGFGVDDTVHGSAVLGQKIGEGFYQNLNGNFEPITIDLWFMRAWGRITGTGVAKTDMKDQLARVDRALNAQGIPPPQSREETIKIAEGVYDKHEKDYKEFQPEYKSGKREKTELVKASERLMLYHAGAMNEQPAGVEERHFITKVFKQALAKLKERDGIELTPASAQAVWWWPEKHLWKKLGTRSKEQDTDYAKSMRKLAEKKRVNMPLDSMDAQPDDYDPQYAQGYAPWVDDPDPPDYLDESDYLRMEEAMLRSRHLYTDAGAWTEELHPRVHGGKFGPSGTSAEEERAARSSRAVKALAGYQPVRNHEPLGKGYSKSAKVVNGVVHTDNVYDAQLALTQDRPVELKQPKQVSTLIKLLGETTKTMVEAGEQAPNFDLCKVTVKGTNLFCADTKGIPRIKMPQMDDDQTKDFIKGLKKMGFEVEKDSEKSEHLRATQNQLDGAKVFKFYERIRKDPDFLGDDKRLVVSKDDYVLDGHHHWAAQIAADTIDNKLGDHKTRVFRVNTDIITLYKLAMKYTGGKGAKAQGQ